MIAELAAGWPLWKRHRATLGRLASFGIVGTVNTCVDLAVFNLFVGGLPAAPANVSGYTAGMWVGWLLNRRYTFPSVSDRRLGMGIFVAVNAVALALTSAAVYATGSAAPGDRFLLNLTRTGAGLGAMLLKFEMLRRWMGRSQDSFGG